jgi:hypothetical protein
VLVDIVFVDERLAGVVCEEILREGIDDLLGMTSGLAGGVPKGLKRS